MGFHRSPCGGWGEPETEKPVPAPVLTPITPSEKKPLLQRIRTAVFVFTPRVIGRAVLDLFGRDKALDSTAILLGYGILVVGILLLWGILDFNALVNTFIEIWRFFFPVK